MVKKLSVIWSPGAAKRRRHDAVKIELDYVGGLGMVFCNVTPFSLLDR
jgi:hypothetical protein